MNSIEHILQPGERAVFALRSLYRGYGYAQYKMSKFEEYDLYVNNKDFLVSDRVITFTDINGRLMALKPDVTLSIIKNFTEEEGCVKKLCYNENVYRVPRGGYGFGEIMQTGLECLGDLDVYNLCEVVTLAVKSLKTVGDDYILDISHMGLVAGILESVSLREGKRGALMTCLGQKNRPGIEKICAECGCSETETALLTSLVSLSGPIGEVLPKLNKLNVSEKTDSALFELSTVCRALEAAGLAGGVRLDFSVINDMAYYSGIVFRGYISGISTGILSGGQYDLLMAKMGKKAGAIGFAVYLDLLGQYRSPEEYDADILLLYDENTDREALLAAVSGWVECGMRVIAQRQIPEKIRCRKTIYMNREGEANAARSTAEGQIG